MSHRVGAELSSIDGGWYPPRRFSTRSAVGGQVMPSDGPCVFYTSSHGPRSSAGFRKLYNVRYDGVRCKTAGRGSDGLTPTQGAAWSRRASKGDFDRPAKMDRRAARSRPARGADATAWVCDQTQARPRPGTRRTATVTGTSRPTSSVRHAAIEVTAPRAGRSWWRPNYVSTFPRHGGGRRSCATPPCSRSTSRGTGIALRRRRRWLDARDSTQLPRQRQRLRSAA